MEITYTDWKRLKLQHRSVLKNRDEEIARLEKEINDLKTDFVDLYTEKMQLEDEKVMDEMMCPVVMDCYASNINVLN